MLDPLYHGIEVWLISLDKGRAVQSGIALEVVGFAGDGKGGIEEADEGEEDDEADAQGLQDTSAAGLQVVEGIGAAHPHEEPGLIVEFEDGVHAGAEGVFDVDKFHRIGEEQAGAEQGQGEGEAGGHGGRFILCGVGPDGLKQGADGSDERPHDDPGEGVGDADAEDGG